MLSTEELMIKRIKVIAPIPNHSEFKVGDILICNDSLLDLKQLFEADELAEFSHFFQELEWWEDRKIEDLPKYVKWTTRYRHAYGAGDVVEVREWADGGTRIKTYSPSVWRIGSHFAPATEQEYITFKKNSNG